MQIGCRASSSLTICVVLLLLSACEKEKEIDISGFKPSDPVVTAGNAELGVPTVGSLRPTLRWEPMPRDAEHVYANVASVSYPAHVDNVAYEVRI